MLNLRPVVATVLALGALPCESQERQFDFQNFAFPFLAGDYHTAPGFRWANELKGAIRLVNGRYEYKCEYPQCPLITLDPVKYADVTGDGKPEAIVPLVYHTGGTQHWRTVYIFKLGGRMPVYLAAFFTGDRADGGLHRVFGNGGKLVVELNDPNENEGDCCATWRERHVFEWRNVRFVEIGTPVLERIPKADRTWRVIK